MTQYDIASLRKFAVARFKDTMPKVSNSTDSAAASEMAYDFYGATADIRDNLVRFISQSPGYLFDLPANKALLGAM